MMQRQSPSRIQWKHLRLDDNNNITEGEDKIFSITRTETLHSGSLSVAMMEPNVLYRPGQSNFVFSDMVFKENNDIHVLQCSMSYKTKQTIHVEKCIKFRNHMRMHSKQLLYYWLITDSYAAQQFYERSLIQWDKANDSIINNTKIGILYHSYSLYSNSSKEEEKIKEK